MYEPRITKSVLREMAHLASSDYLTNGTPLTEAVAKVASISSSNFTAEHVRRICEMTYHDVYERLHKSASGADKYVSFDPPDAAAAAQLLRATKVASHQQRPNNLSRTGNIMTTKIASSSRPKFQAANAFTELVKSADAPEVNWADPNRDIREIRSDIKEAYKSLHTELGGVKTAHDLEMAALIDDATFMYKEGHAIPDILHACFSGMDWGNISKDCAQETANTITEKIAFAVQTVVGMPVNDQATLGEVNPDHPLPRRFGKVASLATQRAHLEIALSEVDSNREYLNKKLEDILYG